MLDDLGDRIADLLSRHQVCVISTVGTGGAWAMPVRYRAIGLEVECVIPRWSDVSYYLEENPNVLLLLTHTTDGALLFWLQYRGTAVPAVAPDWSSLLPEQPVRLRPEELYLAIHVSPRRIDLFDESRGWGARQTLER